MVSNFNEFSEDILLFLCCYLAAGFIKMKRMKAFVNELMCDSSDAKWRQKVIGITFRFNSLSILFFFQREMERKRNAR